MPDRWLTAPPMCNVLTSASMDDSVEIETDLLVLDYLVHHAILACLQSRNTPEVHTPSALGPALSLASQAIGVFKSRHPRYKLHDEIQFRLALLQFVTLFTQRYTRNPSTPTRKEVQRLREKHAAKLIEWRKLADLPLNPRGKASEPLESHQLVNNRVQALRDLGCPQDLFYGTKSCLSYLDLLPLFLQTNFLRWQMMGAEENQITETWIDLVGEYLIQACLEQAFVFGTDSFEKVVDMAFSLGCPTRRLADSCPSQMFWDAHNMHENQKWRDAKQHYRQMLNSQIDSPYLLPYLNRIAKDHSHSSFEAEILNYLHSMATSIGSPVLTQLEERHLLYLGMTQDETQDFMANSGHPVSSFFRDPVGFK
ncbi:hypothetical protein K470DRAFT_273456 [Piedraia hortae CBS 480.64]|uniref:Uncharacterized protein n=1 Tax=Piedraia hortae CBS 480.64 TaxID=1314780 RepID=A0A6A7BPJ0_9PEZI|nr:hypothetical protein K470DRAFT_273456 [Piedraia hortae CBS 480.64]